MVIPRLEDAWRFASEPDVFNIRLPAYRPYARSLMQDMTLFVANDARMTAPHLTAPRILFYAVNGLGLGHVTRLLAIARAVRAQRPQAQVLFLTTSEADNVIFHEGFASVKIPSRTIVQQTSLRPSVYLKLAQTVVMNTVAAFNPAILVADTFPAGATQELLPTLNWEMRRAFVFRSQQADRATDAFFQSALAKYDVCLIPHQEGSEAIPVPPDVRAVWTGEILIRTRSDGLARDAARDALGLPRAGQILYVTFGGGGDDEIANALRVTRVASKDLGWTLAVADAPLRRAPGEEQNGVVTIRHYPMAECFAAFDGAVSAAGYNTVNELMHFGVPSLLLPFPRGLDDQFARVARLVNSGAALTCLLDETPLRAALEQLTNAGTRAALSKTAQGLVPGDGATRAAEELLGLL